MHVKERVIIPVSHYRRNMVWSSTLIFQIGNLLHERLRAHVCECACVYSIMAVGERKSNSAKIFSCVCALIKF